jgi:hypothetical protein
MPDLPDHLVVRAHLVDDFETLRTKTIRTLDEHVRRLSDARHAVTHGSPNVADEFIGRAMDAIDADIARLRGAIPCACPTCTPVR